ncbi:unnamed protein product [Nesidiocoris tenuis]|uniref:Uncharacterized protein n=1 Tax=Nesidiocoris tenuis TaxID=355587 RepID=A0A6H5GNZ1_9HEMI|nr:unnamed protein product [Nesidiocoris tenuis]
MSTPKIRIGSIILEKENHFSPTLVSRRAANMFPGARIYRETRLLEATGSNNPSWEDLRQASRSVLHEKVCNGREEKIVALL